MMIELGHEVYLYAGTQNNARVTEFVTVVSDDERNKWFGDRDWNNEVFDKWNPSEECWVQMNINAIKEIKARSKPGDFIGIIAGRCQDMIARCFPDCRPVEWGVGYEGVLNGFRVFESFAWMHFLYGKYGINDGQFYDTVIPNSFESQEFDFCDSKDDYLLYLGRPTARKGLAVVELLAKRHRVVTAGQGDARIAGTEHVGVVRGQQKKDILAKAKAVLVPTFYIEPFGGVAVEAMLSGTPVITTNFGAFTETVLHGETGFRCSTMAEFYKAADEVGSLNKIAIYKHARYYLTDNIRHQYDTYFRRLQTLDGAGWYSETT